MRNVIAQPTDNGRIEQEGGKAGRFGDCSEVVIGACIEVHCELGHGLLESACEQCLAHELALRGLSFRRQVSVPVEYEGRQLECGYRVELVVERELVEELEAVERLLPVHEAQIITYLRLVGLQAGLLVNFHAETIKRGLRRLGLKHPFPPSRLRVHSSGRTRAAHERD